LSRLTPFLREPSPEPQIYRFCEAIDAAIRVVEGRGSGRVVAFCTDNPHRRTNAAVLAGAYLVLRCGWSGDDAYTPFVGMQPPPLPLRDAAFGLCTFTLTLLDCLRGLDVARRHGIFDWATFDVEAYEHDEQLANGDLNWIVPGLFIAFSGPLDAVKRLSDGRTTWHPRQYREYFRSRGIVAVVRLNKTCYDRATFARAGIAHHDLFYPDGGLAPPDILDRFLRIAERSGGAIGVHCKAGLGRTGTCIGAHLMKHYRMTGRDAIAWLRICRPGSVLGPQQQYLERLQPQMWKLGADDGIAAHARTPPPPPPDASVPVLAASSEPHHGLLIAGRGRAATEGARSAAASVGSPARSEASLEGADAGPLAGCVVAVPVATPRPVAPRMTEAEAETGGGAAAIASASSPGPATPTGATAPVLSDPSPSSAAGIAGGISTPSRRGPPPEQDGVHTPSHGRAARPWPIRAGRAGSSDSAADMGAPTPSASTAQGVEVDSLTSPGGSRSMTAHLVPRRAAPKPPSQAAATGAGFTPDSTRQRSRLGSEARED